MDSSETLFRLREQIHLAREKKRETNELDTNLALEREVLAKKLDTFYTNLSKKVIEINDLVFQHPEGLRVIGNFDNKLSNRRAVQVVLMRDDNKVNLLEDPYLLIEVFADNGEVRFANSNSTNLGDILNVDEINSDELTNRMTEFIAKTYQL